MSAENATEILSGRVLGEQTTNLAPFLSQFSQFLRSFDAYVASPLTSGATAYPRYGGYLPQSDGTTALASPAITGGTITNALSGSFDALSAGTLNLSGALTGTDATFSGTLSAGTLNVAGISSGGAISAPYFTATSTTATSSFAGGLTAANGGFSILQNGNVGIGTTTPGARLTIDNRGNSTSPLDITTNGSAGNYTPANSAIFVRNAAGTELLRIFASDPNGSNNNSGNLYIGYQAGMNNPTDNVSAGYYNTGLGYKAMTANTTGVNNTALGIQSLSSNISGAANTANGANALFRNTTGSDNTALGNAVLYYNQSATNTVAVGSLAGVGAGGAYSNQGGTVVGMQAGFNFATGSDYNTLFGLNSGFGITTGARNVLLGQSTIAASYNQVTTGSNNIAIGNDVAIPSATASNQLVIGNLIYGTGLNGTGATVSTGNIGIGTTTPWGKLSITGSGTGTGLAFAVADSANTPRFVIQDNGNVGVGTSSPTSKLYIDGGTAGNNNLPFATISGGGDSPTSVQLLLRNTREGAGAGGQDYENEVHLRLQAGTTNEHRAYINFANKDGVDQWLTGKNASNAWILYNSTDGHRLWMESTGGVAPNITGNTYLNSAGSGAVQINNGNSDGDTLGTGGFEVFSGGTYPRTSLFKVSSLTATDAVLQATNNGTGYAPASLLLTATNANTRGQGIFHYNTVSDTSWFTGVPYNVAGAKWMVGYESNATWDPAVAQTSKALFTIQDNGNVGIGTTTPTAQLSTTGTVRFSNFGAGTLTTDASGNLSVSSDERLKTIDGAFTRGLADVLQLSPIQYHWNSLSGLDQTTQYAGFSAQNVQSAIPEAVGSSTNGYLTLQDHRR